MSKLSKRIFAAKKKHAEKLEKLALLEKRDDVKLREDHLEKLAEVACPEYNNHSGVAPAFIY